MNEMNGVREAAVDDVMLFTKLLDNHYIWQCACQHYWRGAAYETCPKCGRWAELHSTPASEEAYKASRR